MNIIEHTFVPCTLEVHCLYIYLIKYLISVLEVPFLAVELKYMLCSVCYQSSNWFLRWPIPAFWKMVQLEIDLVLGFFPFRPFPLYITFIHIRENLQYFIYYLK